jgi:hypothetical protein
MSAVDRKRLTCGKIEADVKYRLSMVGTSLRGPAATSAVKAVVAVHRMSYGLAPTIEVFSAIIPSPCVRNLILKDC